MANLIKEGDKLLRYRYKVAECNVIGVEGVEKIDPFKIVGITIEHDFINSFFPIFKMTTVMEPHTYKKILANKNKAKFHIRIQKYTKELLEDKKSLYTDWINDTFIMYWDDDESHLPDDIYEKRREIENIPEDQVNLHDLDNTIEFYFFQDKYVDNTRKLINNIFTGLTMTTCITKVFNMAGISGVLMTPLDNTKTYSGINPIILPPQDILDTLLWLDQQFGLYKTGAIMYFSHERPYILKFDGKCSAWEPEEWKQTVFLISEHHGGDIEESISSSLERPGEKIFYINTVYDSVNVTNNSIIKNVVSGLDTDEVIPSLDVFNSKESSARTRSGTNYAKKVLNESMNPWVNDAATALVNAHDIILQVTVSNCNLEAFWPNKEATFVFEDTERNEKYKGKYKPAFEIIKFVRDGYDFTVDVSASYLKVE